MFGISRLLIRYKLTKIKYIVWDFDGTLYQDEAIGKYIYDRYIDYLNIKSEDSRRKFNELSQKYGSWSNAASKILKISELDFLTRIEGSKKYKLNLKTNKKLVKKVEALSGYTHFILTNSTISLVSEGLRSIGFKNKNGMAFFPFQKIFARDITKVLKPNKKAFLNVMRYTNEPAEKHLLIGDSYMHDIKPAHDVGFLSFDVNYFWKEIAPLISK